MKSYPPAPVDLLAGERQAERSEDAPASAGRGRPLRVLVVEDNVDSAEALQELLRLWGHEAQLAYDGRTGLAVAAGFAPDVVLLDIGLPGMDGYEVAEELRRRESATRTLLVALTGFGRREDRERAWQAGIDHHFTKPVDLSTLRDLLARA